MLIYAKYAMSTLCGILTMHKLCKKWDEKLNKLLDEHWKSAVAIGVEDLNSSCNYGPTLHTVQLGDCLVWVSNRYYSYGYLYQYNIREGYRWGISVEETSNFRCKVSTMARLDNLCKEIYNARNKAKKESHNNIVDSIA